MGVIAKQSIQGTIVTYLGVAVGFVTTFFVLTRFLTAEEIGLARVLIDAATLFVGLAQLGTNSSIIRFYPYFKDDEQNKAHGFFFWTILIPFVGFVLFSLLWWICKTPVSDWFAEKSPLFIDYYYFVIPISFGMLYQTVFETNANVRLYIVVPRAVRELIVRIGLLVIYLLYAFGVLTMDGFVIALCINYLLAALINITYLFSLGENISLLPDMSFLCQNKDLVKQYLSYTLFLLVSALTSVLAPLLSSFFITAQMGLHYTGIFAIATYMAVMVSIPYRSLTAIASPELAVAIKEKDKQKTTTLMQQVANNLLLIGGLILLAIWVNIDLIFHLLPNGELYAQAKQVVLVLGISQLVLSVFSITLNVLNFSHYYIFSLLWSTVLTVSSIMLNNYLIPKYGMDGAAWSNLLSYTVYFTLIIITIGSVLRISPFCKTQAYTCMLLLSVFVLNHLCLCFLPISNIWISSVLRSVILFTFALWVAYRWRLSPELSGLLKSKLKK